MATKTRTISRDLLERALDIANMYEAEIRDEYSGRGMAGRECVGVTMLAREMPRFFAALGALIVEDEMSKDQWDGEPVEDAVELAEAVQLDSMGLDRIVYWPGYTLED